MSLKKKKIKSKTGRRDLRFRVNTKPIFLSRFLLDYMTYGSVSSRVVTIKAYRALNFHTCAYIIHVYACVCVWVPPRTYTCSGHDVNIGVNTRQTCRARARISPSSSSSSSRFIGIIITIAICVPYKNASFRCARSRRRFFCRYKRRRHDI